MDKAEQKQTSCHSESKRNICISQWAQRILTLWRLWKVPSPKQALLCSVEALTDRDMHMGTGEREERLGLQTRSVLQPLPGGWPSWSTTIRELSRERKFS